MDEILAVLAGQDHRGSIVGPRGSGKTTLLEQLADHLTGRIVWVRLNAESGRPFSTAHNILRHEPGPKHTILIDGSEQLSPWSWWRIHHRIRAAGTIVITSHQPGRLPALYECTTDPELLEDLVRKLAPQVTESTDLHELFHRHGGNIRLCFRELYDWCARTGASTGAAAVSDAAPEL